MPENPAQERRRYPRYQIFCPIEYKAEDREPKETSATLNISEGGALISARRSLVVASNLIVKLKLRNELFLMIGKVRHIRQNKENDTYEIGIEFWERPKTFRHKFYEELDRIKDYQERYKTEQGSEISLPEASLNWYKDTSGQPQ